MTKQFQRQNEESSQIRFRIFKNISNCKLKIFISLDWRKMNELIMEEKKRNCCRSTLSRINKPLTQLCITKVPQVVMATFSCMNSSLTESIHLPYTIEYPFQDEKEEKKCIKQKYTHLRAKASCASIAVFLPLKGGGLGVRLKLLLNLLGFSILFFLSL